MTASSPSPASIATPAQQPGLTREARKRLSRLLRENQQQIVRAWYDSQFDGNLVRRYGIAGVNGTSREVLEKHFLDPLFGLLNKYLDEGGAHYLDVYLDERLRYAPHQAESDVRVEFFSEVIPRDEAALSETVKSPDLRRELQRFLTEVHLPLLTREPATGLKLLAVGDCLMGEVRVFLPSACRRADIHLDMRAIYFSALMGRELSSEQVFSFIDSMAPDLLSFSFLTYEALPGYPALLREAHSLRPSEITDRVESLVSIIRHFLTEVRSRTDVPFLLHNAGGLPLERWRQHLPFVPAIASSRRKVLQLINERLRELAEHTPNTILVDEAMIATQHGHRDSSGNVIPPSIAKDAYFHTSRFGQYLVPAYLEVTRAYAMLRKTKVLLVDFDNTLWQGVMADGPVQHEFERQELLRHLKDAGILLVAVSKNDPGNVRWEEMRLTPEDFVLMKISWDLKPLSIRATAEQLDLGLDSFVLIDDNPAERELVRGQLPEVTALDAADPFTWRALRLMLAFPNTRQTDESRKRTELYRAQAQRREVLSHAMDYPAMMASLGLEAQFRLAQERDLDRVTELIQRTNQFNTTTIRYSRADLQRLLRSQQHAIYAAELSDKFGRLGLVAVVIIERQDTRAIFDTFVMSCRAMGMELERLTLLLVLDAESQAREFVGRFVPTDRNTPAARLYASCGFQQQGLTEWVLAADNARPEKPAWLKVLPQ